MGVPILEGGGGGRWGDQDRARGRHLTAVNTLSALGRFNERGGGGGGGGGGCCSHLADSISEMSALSANPIIQSVGEGCCPIQPVGARMYAAPL